MLCCYCMGLCPLKGESTMSLQRILKALLCAAGVAVFFTAVGWQWAFWLVVLGTFLALAWPLLRWLLQRS